MRFHPTEVDKIAGNPSYQLEYSLFDETDGMQLGSQTWQAGVGGVRGGDGRLWVATGLGMTVIDPRSLPPSHRPPPPRIDGIMADGRRVAADRGLSLPAGTSNLRIEFGTVSLLRLVGATDGPGDCLGFLKGTGKPGLRISGWSCQGITGPIKRAAVGCMLNRLTLLATGRDAELTELFTRAELKRSACGPNTPSVGSTDWVTSVDNPRLRGTM